MHPSHRLDSHSFFFRTVCAIHSKKNLSIHRHRFFKHRQPVDIPTSEDASWIACDGEEDRRTIGTRQSYGTTDVLKCIVGGSTNDRFLGNLEALVRLQCS